MTGTRLDGARVLVTGATGGLGRLLVAGAARRGARVAVSARDEGRLREAHPDAVAHLAADLTLPGAPAEVVGAAVEALEGLDVLVSAAGVVAFGPVADADDDLLDELLLTAYLGPVRLLRAALPHLRTAGGQREGDAVAVMLSAVVAEQPVAGMAAYSAAKAALTAFDAAAAKELRREGVRVLDVRPPHTETGLATRPVAGTAPRMPQGLAPEDVAERVLRAVEEGERDLPSSAFGGR
ncbi:SDR family NAD(P)-dependent oxidoreductase [Pseudokineococcus lusitanus]|uniref:Cyclic-di-GMP-binding biofilm dispersal mediator protein n=1 Tax=Pseudokineococcus lusitanus TaxID=763993 RepID=A0A3N1HKD0_9ACTN|nr:SDR family oxidoreductase [Pseudokineococcus lusitanus]ROP42940.1 cyclic-di-GMP-binding biofilm dispersal mediator protein [Pseudokineococcus lusitanus]